MKILLAEDEKDLSKALSVIFKKNNYTVDQVYNGEDATAFIDIQSYDLIILDVMMPKKNGIEVLKDLRKSGNNTPVLILSAKGEIDDKVLGLECGADDYLPKPFDVKELVARVRALTRRKTEISDDDITFGNTTFSRNESTISTTYGCVSLLNKELQILEALLTSPSSIISSDKIIDKVWCADDYSTSNNLWVFISYIRRKLEQIHSNVIIKSHRNIGYSLELEDEKN